MKSNQSVDLCVEEPDVEMNQEEKEFMNAWAMTVVSKYKWTTDLTKSMNL